MFNAECHCGNVKLAAKEPPPSLTSCNCSICNRIGALWAYYLSERVEIETSHTNFASYSWGKKSIDFHHCTNCGCVTHYTSIRENGDRRTAINARMASPTDIDSIPVQRFDGAVSWKYLDDTNA